MFLKLFQVLNLKPPLCVCVVHTLVSGNFIKIKNHNQSMLLLVKVKGGDTSVWYTRGTWEPLDLYSTKSFPSTHVTLVI